jgi:hypothetical protein
MDQETRDFIIATNKKKLNLSDDVTYAKFYHLTSTKNVKNILRNGFKPYTWFATNEQDANVYKRQVIKPYLMVCLISLDGILPSGDYFTSQHKLIQGSDSIWRPVST